MTSQPTPPRDTLDRLDLVDVIGRHVAFTWRAFGPGPRLAGTLAHIRKELAEIEADPHDVEEWVDVILLAINGAAQHGHDAAGIAAALVAKIAKNEARTWPDWRTADPDAPIEHVKGEGVGE